mmetsp:Transcript_15759/g.53092  ORF Transcript_15759/g.53092 Transcript_15759/m.53092 type:complete len:214 (-) Transcript_15759:488-1129(-)
MCAAFAFTASQRRTNSRVMATGAMTLHANVASHACWPDTLAPRESTVASARARPALFTRINGPPRECATAASNTSAAAPAAVTSATTGTKFPRPSALSRAARASRRSARRATPTTTPTPRSRRNASQSAAPMPALAPVTMATPSSKPLAANLARGRAGAAASSASWALTRSARLGPPCFSDLASFEKARLPGVVSVESRNGLGAGLPSMSTSS